MVSAKQGVSCFLTVVLLIISLTGFSQNSKIDSLKSIVATGARDSVMVKTLNALSTEVLINENIPESLVYAKQAEALADTLGYKKGQAYSLKNIGLVQYYQGEFLEVLDSWTKSLETFEEIRDTMGIATLVNNLGAVYYSQGSNAKALDYYLRSLSISERIKDPFRISQALLNIGGLYAEMEELDKAREYFSQIEAYRTGLNNPTITVSYLMGIGEVNYKQGKYEEALSYYEEALSINDVISLRAGNLIKLSEAELKLGNVENSISYLNNAYETAKSNNQQLLEVQALIAIGSVYQKNNSKRALNAYIEAEVLAKEMEANDELRAIYEGMSKVYTGLGNYKKAYEYQSNYLELKDLIFNLETDDKIRGLQFDFDLSKKEDEIGLLEKEAQIQELTEKRQKNVLFGAGIALFLIILLAISLYRRYKFIQETNLIIETEKNRSESLLLNILPEETAHELKENGKVKAKSFEAVTVMFTDFVGFTSFAKNLKPEELVNSVDYYFSRFDEIMEKHDVEKIKTIGDAYMSAGGLPEPDERHVFNVIDAAFEIIQFINESKDSERMKHQSFDIRVGINTGPIVAGVVGTKKFAYDIWGDTVNVASRMETKSEPGKINISESTYKLIKDDYDCEYRGEIDVKHKGMMKMYFVNGPGKKASQKKKVQKQSISKNPLL